MSPSGHPRKTLNYHTHERNKGRLYSALLHLLFLFFCIVGLPSFLYPPLPVEPPVISVEILPMSTISNVKPSETPPAPQVKPEEKKPEEKKPSPPVKTADATPPPPPAPVVEKPKEKTPEPKKEKPPEPKKEEKKKPKEDDLAAVLKAVKDTAQKEKKEDQKKDVKEDTSPNKTMSNKYNSDLPMSMSEKDVIMSQLAKCWSVPAGAKDAQNLVVVIDAQYATDGTYLKVALAQESMSRYNSDTFFRAAADSALRAVKECSPLKNLPPEKYETWRDMELRFDPKFMLN